MGTKAGLGSPVLEPEVFISVPTCFLLTWPAGLCLFHGVRTEAQWEKKACHAPHVREWQSLFCWGPHILYWSPGEAGGLPGRQGKGCAPEDPIHGPVSPG